FLVAQPQRDRAVARADAERRSAVVQLTDQLAPVQAALHADRQVDVDVAVARSRVEPRVDVVRDPQAPGAVAGLQAPRGRELRARAGGRVDAAVARAQVQRVEAAVRGQVAVARARAQAAVQVVQRHPPVARMDLHLALQAPGADRTVAGLELDAPA